MNLIIDKKEYKVRYDLLSRFKMLAAEVDERELINQVQQGERIPLFKFVYYCIHDYVKPFEDFLKCYPNMAESDIVMLAIFSRLIEEAGNPYNIPLTKEKEQKEKEQTKVTGEELRTLLVTIMSKGYTQEQALNMTFWDINLIFEADNLRTEKEAFYVNAILNYTKAFMGVKGASIDILNRNSKQKQEKREKIINLIENVEAAYNEKK